MKKRIIATLSLMCVTVVMFALVIALNPKLTVVDATLPINPVQNVNTETSEPISAVSQNETADLDTSNDADNTSHDDINQNDVDDMSHKYFSQADALTPDVTSPTHDTDQPAPHRTLMRRPRFFVHFDRMMSADDFLYGKVYRDIFHPEYDVSLLDDDTSATRNIFYPAYDIALLDDDTSDTKADSTTNYYALYDEYDLSGENYQVTGHSFVMSNDSSYIDRFSRTTNIVPHVRAGHRPDNAHSVLSISPVSTSDDCDTEAEKVVETSATSQTLTPKYQITTIKKYPRASRVMHIVTIVASLLTSAFIGYLIYRLLRA